MEKIQPKNWKKRKKLSKSVSDYSKTIFFFLIAWTTKPLGWEGGKTLVVRPLRFVFPKLFFLWLWALTIMKMRGTLASLQNYNLYQHISAIIDWSIICIHLHIMGSVPNPMIHLYILGSDSKPRIHLHIMGSAPNPRIHLHILGYDSKSLDSPQYYWPTPPPF